MHGFWAVLLLLCAGFYVWWERPAEAGAATLRFTLQVQGLPQGTRGALWSGPTKAWTGSWDPGQAWRPSQEGKFTFPPQPVPIARRRFKQGLLLKRTHDLVVILLEAPNGSRRYFIYDLREDLAVGLLRMNRGLGLEGSCSWEELKGEVVVPGEKTRNWVGY
jgi:hypothetical protein